VRDIATCVSITFGGTRAAALVAVLLVSLLAPPLAAVEPVKMTGTLAGRVTDAAGVPQMGATVFLFNRFERMMDRVLTDAGGAFLFSSLLPEQYSVRVSLASFVPAIKRNVAVQAGLRSYLAVSLTSMLSTVELVYMPPGQKAVMSEEWKWVLRGAGATRPVLRLLPGIDISDPTRPRQRNIFAGTRGLVKLSAGDGGALAAAGSQADLGTAFALATSLFGGNQVGVSGNFAYGSNAGIPIAGFRTSFSREQGFASNAEVHLTMRQVYLPARIGSALSTAASAGIPALQSMALSFSDRRQIGDLIEIEYGSSIETVSFLNRLNYISPFARIRYGDAQSGSFEFAYSSGTPATELLDPDEVPGAELSHQISTLSLFPRVSLRGGNVHVQRAENFEFGYRRAIGSRTYSAGIWREDVSNAAMLIASPGGFYGSSDLMPDLASNSNVFNAGSYRRTGYTASVTQKLGEDLNATVAYGFGGVLTNDGKMLQSGDPGQLRRSLSGGMRQSLTARVSGVSPFSGTRFITSYQFTDYRVLQPVHLSLTQRTTLEPGLNLAIRQPIPGANLLFGRLEASADLRNLLAQGYLPLTTSDGRRIILIHAPRSIRGGLAFIF
jgi:hypothetical protein